MRQRATLAKLSRPRLSAPLPRERLFAELDRLVERPVIAVIGPPGAGKTTLVASYLEAREISGIWYQVDAGDADAATFFYYLRLAADEAAPSDELPLELLAPEYMSDLPGFSRRFFRHLYARLEAPGVVVFDNFQDAPEDSAFVTLVREGLAEIPDHVNVILCSRADPPPDFARFVVNEHMGLLDWGHLRLSLDEVRRIAQTRFSLDEPALRELHARSDGWAAGVTLMLEHVKRTGQIELSRASDTAGTVFNYFAGEIFNRASPELQELLLRTACSGLITVGFAEQITDNPKAGVLLEELYRRHYFTYRRNEFELSYVYHSLFREFLLRRAGELWSREEVEAHNQRAAGLLASAGEIESAVGLYLQARDYDAATQLILREAGRLLASGRWQTLGGWMRALPAGYVQGAPWLLYWWGTSLIPVNQTEARSLLERCFQGMNEDDDRLGQLLAASGVIETWYFEWATFRPMDPWITVIAERLDPAPAFPSLDDELRVHSALLIALSYRAPGNPLLPRLVEHVTRLLDSAAEVNRKVTAATFLLGYCYFASDYALAERILGLIRPLANDRELTPLNQLWWRARLGYYAFHIGEYDDAVSALNEARDIADRHGLGGLHAADALIYFFKSLVAFSRSDLAAADECIRALVRVVKPHRRFDFWYLHYSRSVMALRQGDLEVSHREADLALRVAAETGMIYVEGLSQVLLAHVLVRRERFDDALSAITNAAALFDATVLDHFSSELLLIEASISLRQGDQVRGRELAREGLRQAQKTNYSYWFRWAPDTLPAVFADALAAGIDPDYVRDVVRRYGYAAPYRPRRDWPRPLQLTALGGFGLIRDGVAIDISRVGTRKPLEVLKAIVACGGQDVEAGQLTDLLWPDAEGDAAQKSLQINLHRLRKQLGSERAVTLRQGKVGIDPGLCWIDVLAFDRLGGDAELLLRSEPKLSSVQATADALIDLYRGDLLPQDTELPWLSAPRNRLRARFLRLVSVLGKVLEDARDYDRAIALCWRGLEFDHASEAFYQRLIACYQQTGRRAEAEDAYRRCLGALARTTGRRPGTETEALGRAIQGTRPS